MNEPMQLDSLDKKILSFITSNARMAYLEIARECNVSGGAIHQRIQKMTNMGVIKNSEFIVDPKKLGYSTCAYMGIFLEKASLYKDVVEKLEKIPEIVECHYITGNYTIFAKIFAKNNEHLKNILIEELQSINGITSTETFISLDERFKRQCPFD